MNLILKSVFYCWTSTADEEGIKDYAKKLIDLDYSVVLLKDEDHYEFKIITEISGLSDIKKISDSLEHDLVYQKEESTDKCMVMLIYDDYME